VPARPPTRRPVTTYRLQLNASFTLHDAAAVIPWLATLGITECYCSPLLASRPGSAHGYDVTDHARVDPELGGEDGFQALTDAVRQHDMGLIVDFVPNHMSADPVANAWWRSVLANGPSSPYATYFDIDWDPVYPELKQKLLLPILGERYGETLENGFLQLEFEDGAVRLRYYDRALPLNPRILRPLLARDLERLATDLGTESQGFIEFQSVLFHLEHLPVYTDTDPERMAERQREADVALTRLDECLRRWPAIRQHVDTNIRLFNGQPGDPGSFDQLHDLLEAQPYRLAFWRTAGHEINYRRFFDQNHLAALRPEDPRVFEAMHVLVGRWIREETITGIRLDHVDGLFDPGGYLADLEAACGDARPYVVVEKILTGDETLARDWRVHGTTGYDFLNDVCGLFIDEANGRRVLREYARFTGINATLADVAYHARQLIITTSMASELNVLAFDLNRLSGENRYWRDLTFDSLQETLREIVACFPVYRTYVSATGWSPFDQECVAQAIREALRRNPALEPSIFGFMREMLLPTREAGVTSVEFDRRLRFAMKFQQFTGPVQAKGIEDTAFYRHAPLLALNEVGGEPAVPGVSVEAFHQRNEQRQRHWPFGMLATATHDTKRGEDARARLAVLSEVPERWRSALTRWRDLNAHVRSPGSTAPDAADEYFYYQTLVGAWPPGRRDADPAFHARLRDCMRKAMREAKVHTSWINPSEAYEEATLRFVDVTLGAPEYLPFRRSLASFASRVAHLGMLNSLSQVVLKMSAPGVPDVYQGSELWDLNLVDPDNRRSVDFAQRQRLLRGMEPLLDEATPADERAQGARRLLARWPDGRIKLFVTAASARLRRRLPDVFLSGGYRPVAVTGTRARHVVSFVRHLPPWRVLVVVPRLVAGLAVRRDDVPVGDAAWGDTSLHLPDGDPGGVWRDVFTGSMIDTRGTREARLASVLAAVPVGLYVAGPG
jgi:(1->4)-alpha-D-glucan 1-alpha-D-glucosylmutase